MKQLFLTHYQKDPDGKVLLRFGPNHLHRGYDARGVSTLGNLVSEWALAQNKTVFNVGVFATGGKERLAGKTFDADERQDELTFALLADMAGTNATLLDLRPLRLLLHAVASEKRSPVETNRIYWSDSYDYLPTCRRSWNSPLNCLPRGDLPRKRRFWCTLKNESNIGKLCHVHSSDYAEAGREVRADRFT